MALNLSPELSERLARVIIDATPGFDANARNQAAIVIGLLLSGDYTPGRVGEFIILTPKKVQ